MKALRYVHHNLSGLEHSRLSRSTLVSTSTSEPPGRADPLEIALFTVRLARRLGVTGDAAAAPALLPYGADHDTVLFDAPFTSLIAGRRVRFLRGWKQYGSCVKGFNALGLLVEHIIKELRRLEVMDPTAVRTLTRRFLATRTVPADNGDHRVAVFSSDTVTALPDRDLDSVPRLDLAIWLCYANRPIVCSTSSNMGISLHQALRAMQNTWTDAAGHRFTLLNDDEGLLIIWCPDEKADFMNSEKTEILRSLEGDLPRLTTLRTYINRKQRDPGALRDALEGGGYFFPTNPQSRDEIQNLLVAALTNLSQERRCAATDLLRDDRILYTLGTLDCTVGNDQVVVHSGIEGGLYGLMVPYLLMLDETLARRDTAAVSTWNQASIGAALAAAVLADVSLRQPESLTPEAKAGLAEFFPHLAKFLQTDRLGRTLLSRIHGVFDVANLQSLAQLLGVVVIRHLSGRGTAYVGLGSSSYANGNFCFDILDRSAGSNGPFVGKETFHPATHTLNPVAQALVFAEDWHRAASSAGFAALDPDARLRLLATHVRKPEPAGAAALAGYLLARLDAETLSVVELAHALRLAGFDQALFLDFAGFSRHSQGANSFIQEASEEGPFMEEFATTFLHCLSMDTETLAALAKNERAQSGLNYLLTPLDPPAFQGTDSVVNIYLTGDNTIQPPQAFFVHLLTNYLTLRTQLAAVLAEDQRARAVESRLAPFWALNLGFAAASTTLGWLQQRLDATRKGILKAEVRRRVARLSNG